MGHISQTQLTQINTKTDASQVSYFHFKQSFINLCSYKSHFLSEGEAIDCAGGQGCFSEDETSTSGPMLESERHF